MKFKIDTKVFEEKLSIIQGIAEKRATMPILSHVLVTTTKNEIRLVATDLETTMSLSCEASVEKESSLSIPSRKLFEIIKELPEGEIEVEDIGNNWIELRTSSGQYKIAGLPAEDFPALPDVSSDNLFSIPSNDIEEMISKTIFSVSPDDLRRNLSGIYFEKTGDRSLRLVATDGHRLGFIDYESDQNIGLSKNVLIPKKAVMELGKVLRHSENVSIGCETNFFVSKVNGITLCSRLIDADFPDYRQVTPDTTKHKIKINKLHLLSAVRRASIFSSEKTKSIRFVLSKKNLKIMSKVPEVGDATESIILDYAGEDVEIGFNSRYLIDVLEAIDDPIVVVGLTDELSPVLIVPETSNNYVNVIMPMRV